MLASAHARLPFTFHPRARVFKGRMGKGGINPYSPPRVAPVHEDVESIARALGGGTGNSGNPEEAEVVAGLWVGEAWPSPECLAQDPTVPTNPIRWSLTLDADTSASVTAFGAGYFDDSADVPGHTHLWFTLRGHFDARTREVRLDKVYERPAPKGEAVRYVGKLHALNGAPEITGTWENATHGTNGTFSCMLRTGEGAQDGDAIARSLGGR